MGPFKRARTSERARATPSTRATARTTSGEMSVPPSLVVERGEALFANCVFALDDVRGAMATSALAECEKLIAHHGGSTLMEGERNGATHALASRASDRETWDEDVTVAHPEWLLACARERKRLDVSSNVLFRPPKTMDGLPEMKSCVVSLTGYAGGRRRDVETMTRVLGAKFQKAFDRSVTHLVCYEHSGAKFEKAKEFGSAHIVNHVWLEDCISRWQRLGESAYSRSGKEEDELAAQRVPDSEDEGDLVIGQTSVVPDSVVEGGSHEGKCKSTSDAITVLPNVSQGAAPSTGTKKTPSTKNRGASQSKSHSAIKRMNRSPDWEEQVRRGVNVTTSVRNRLDPSLRRALQDGSTQPDSTFTGIVGSPNDVENALGGRFAPSNSWFAFADDADNEPLTDMATLDDFYNLVARGRRSFGGDNTDEKLYQIEQGELRFEVFENGISEALEEDLIKEESPMIVQTLYSGTVVIVHKRFANCCDEVMRLVDALELQQRQGPIGKWIQAMLRVETAKQLNGVGEDGRLKPGSNALMKTFKMYLQLQHQMNDTDQAQLFNENGALAPADKIITLPARAPGNIRGIILQEVQRPLRDILAGFYELLAGPTEPDPTQQPLASQQFLSQMEMEEEEGGAMAELAEDEEIHEPPVISEEVAGDPETAEEAPAAAPSQHETPAAILRKSSRYVPSKPSTSKKKTKSTPKSAATPKGTVTKVKTPKHDENVNTTHRKAYITLSGFSSAGIKKYSAVVRKIGGILCTGHEWEPSTTHVVFGERGSRSIKFLAGAVAGASLLDVSYLDACAAAGKVLSVTTEHLWRGGRGAEMGVISAHAAERWSKVPGSTAFSGLSVAIVPFAAHARIEQKMLDTVLRAGGASISIVSPKGDVCLTQAEVPDIVVSGQVEDTDSPKDVPRLEALLEGGVDSDVVVVSSEFFKAWISTPEAALDEYCMFGTSLKRACVENALAKRGETIKQIAAPPSKNARTPASKPKATGKSKNALTTIPVPSQQRQTRAKRAADAPLATRVRSKRRVPLADASNT